MAFGARNEDGWRLCHRKGRTVLWISQAVFPDVSIVFKSQARAKACADELNETLWKPYAKWELKNKAPDDDVFWAMIEIIHKHGGLTDAQMEVIRNA